MLGKFFKSNAMRRMHVAREKVARKSPFFASIIFGARLRESNNGPDMWTDGIDVFFNPEWVDAKENDPFIEGWFLHNILHCALLHQYRMKHRDRERWGKACDFSLNPLVNDYFPLPPTALTDAKYKNLPAEKIYDLLEEQEQQGGGGGKGKGQSQQPSNQPGGMTPPQDGEGDGEGNGEGDGEGNGEGDAESRAEQAQRDWKRRVGNAMDKAKGIGVMPGNIERLVQELLPKDKLDWKDVIRDMSRDAKDRVSRTWSRRSRRRDDDVPMPGYGNDNLYRLVIALDVSGSVGEEMLRDMCSECASLLDQDLVTHVSMYAVDTRITDKLEATSAEEIQQWKPRGGGGTDFSSAMDIIGRETDCIGLVFLTDMMTGSFGKQPDFPVVWVNWLRGSNATAPFGRTLQYYD